MAKREQIMASHFKILIHQSSDTLHLKLEGDFDGTSAYELINTIKKYSNRFARVFIHTSGVKQVFDFGRNVFQNSFPAKGDRSAKFIFTGQAGRQLAPEGCRLAYL